MNAKEIYEGVTGEAYPTYVESLITVEELRDKDARIAALEAALTPLVAVLGQIDPGLEAAPEYWGVATVPVSVRLLREAEKVLDTTVQNREARIAELEAENERQADALEQIRTWANAYPLAVFPEPDFKKAAAVLKENGMTLDAISASNMRHVLDGVMRIAAAALEGAE